LSLDVLANDYQHTALLYIESLRCGEPEPLWLLAQSNTAVFADQASSVLGFTTRRSLQQALAARSNGRLHLDP
jgi:hypothetical protein